MICNDIVFFEIFPWNENFETGIDLIDEQHKQLVNILNKLAAHLANHSDEIVMNDIFDELASYADYHFKTEEKIWYDNLGEDEWSLKHEQTHGSFISHVIDIKSNKDDKPLDDVVYEIVSFLSKWLAYHILDTDKRLAIAVREVDAGISLEEAKKIADEEMNGSMKVIVETVLVMYDTLSNRTLDLMREKSLRIKAEEALEISEERQKEKEYLLQNSRMAQMGEMISMIAHQWKQPLNSISVTSSSLQINLTMDKFNLTENTGKEMCKNHFNEKLNYINDIVKSLSTTMDDFRNFYNPNKIKKLELIQSPVVKALYIMRASLVFDGITIEEIYNSKNMIKMYENELIQVVLNILKNAQDNFKEKKTQNPEIKITTESNNNINYLKICDNGGGISNDIIDKIFDIYFSTKSDKQGTGLGLHMSKTIVESHHNGRLYAQNLYNTEKIIIGTCFIIEINDTKK